MLSLAGFAGEDQGEPTEKRTRQAEGFYRNLQRGVCLKAEKISPKIPEKIFFPIFALKQFIQGRNCKRN